ncbi:hypothetical protein JCM15415_12170 [Methanobacterium movens]
MGVAYHNIVKKTVYKCSISRKKTVIVANIRPIPIVNKSKEIMGKTAKIM